MTTKADVLTKIEDISGGFNRLEGPELEQLRVVNNSNLDMATSLICIVSCMRDRGGVSWNFPTHNVKVFKESKQAGNATFRVLDGDER